MKQRRNPAEARKPSTRPMINGEIVEPLEPVFDKRGSHLFPLMIKEIRSIERRQQLFHAALHRYKSIHQAHAQQRHLAGTRALRGQEPLPEAPRGARPRFEALGRVRTLFDPPFAERKSRE